MGVATLGHGKREGPARYKLFCLQNDAGDCGRVRSDGMPDQVGHDGTEPHGHLLQGGEGRCPIRSGMTERGSGGDDGKMISFDCL